MNDEPKRLGFTGTRRGMTDAQKARFREGVIHSVPSEFHHGACEGADAEAATIVAMLARWEGLPCLVVAHPGKSAKGGDNEFLSDAALMVSAEQRPTLTHFARNRNIVNACDHLVACPWQTEIPEPGTGGGTWYTIVYATKAGKQVTIIWPDGRTERAARDPNFEKSSLAK